MWIIPNSKLNGRSSLCSKTFLCVNVCPGRNFCSDKETTERLKAYSMFKVSIKFYCNVAIKNNKKQDSNEYSIRTLWTCSVNSKHCSLYSKLLYWYNWVKMKIDHVDVWHHLNSVGDQHYPRNITIPINTELILSSFMRFQGSGHLNTRLWSVNVPARRVNSRQREERGESEAGNVSPHPASLPRGLRPLICCKTALALFVKFWKSSLCLDQFALMKLMYSFRKQVLVI